MESRITSESGSYGEPLTNKNSYYVRRMNMESKSKIVFELSSTYAVRIMTADDVNIIYELSLENALFYQYCPPFVTKESIEEDMKALPPGMSYDDKFYVGFFKESKLIAVMDFVFDYPNEETRRSVYKV